MARYWTWNEIKAKVEADLDLEGEVFITESELLGYANEAIDEVERQVHMLCEDYFLSRTPLTLVNGQEAYDLPTDIYAMKIRDIIYRNGTSVFKMIRIPDWHKFEQYEAEQVGITNTMRYGFMILNETAGAPKIIITPTPTEDGVLGKIYYIRNANELVLGTDVCDLPEAVNYVMQYVKVRCYEKEGHPNLPKAMADLEAEKQTTITALANMVPDNLNEIEPDLRLYDDMN